VTPPDAVRHHHSTSAIPSPQHAGVAFGVAAYVWWGLSSIYFKAVSDVPPMVVLGHRVVWSVVLLGAVVAVSDGWSDIMAVVRRPALMLRLAVSTAFLTINWLVFIYAISTERAIDASLGYFINPLFTVVLGMVFLGERLNRTQWAAVACAAAGVAYLSVARGGLPWIALALPATFGIYGLIRKQTPVGALPGLLVETALLAPLAAAYLLWAHSRPGSDVINTPATIALLLPAGVVTSVPLLWFVAAARRLPLATLGFMQYINPTLQFLVAVLMFGEPLGTGRLVAFGVIWTAVAIYITDMIRRSRAVRNR
jgi:chloramphenicol-sensitive protein RarD